MVAKRKDMAMTGFAQPEHMRAIEFGMRLVVVRPEGAALDRFIGLAGKRPGYFAVYAKEQLLGDVNLAFLEADDATHLPLDEPCVERCAAHIRGCWRTCSKRLAISFSSRDGVRMQALLNLRPEERTWFVHLFREGPTKVKPEGSHGLQELMD